MIADKIESPILRAHLDKYEQGGGYSEGNTPEELFNHNVAFALHVVKGYKYDGVSRDELAQEALCGLWTAAQRFDPSSGAKFSSYAVWWIRASLTRYLCMMAQPVRIPENVWSAANRRIRGVEAEDDDRISRPKDESVTAMAVAARKNHFSLDAQINENDGDTTMHGAIEDESVVDPTDTLFLAQIGDALEEGLSRLPERMAYIITHYYGLFGSEQKTLESMAPELGVSRERVRQLRDQGMQYIKVNSGGEFGYVRSVAEDSLENMDVSKSDLPWVGGGGLGAQRERGQYWDDSNGAPTCRMCGSDEVAKAGKSKGSGTKFQRWRCRRCYSTSNGTTPIEAGGDSE